MLLACSVVAILLAGAGCGRRTSSALDRSGIDIPGLVLRTAPSVVLVTCMDGDGDTLCTGTGFFTSANGHVVTNRHVILGAAAATVKTTDGSIYNVAGIASEDTVWDLVVLATSARREPGGFLSVSTTEPAVGTHVLVIGSPLGLEQTVTDGIVSAVRDIPKHGKVIQITAPISAGSSGSPVVNSSGDVVGVATFYLQGGQNLNFAVPGGAVTAMVFGKPTPLAQRPERTGRLFAATAFPDAQTDSLRPLDACILGLHCLLNQYYAAAASAFERAYQSATDDTLQCEAALFAGCSWFLQDSLSRSLDCLQRASRVWPESTDLGTMAYSALGYAFILTDKLPEALSHFSRADDFHTHADYYYRAVFSLLHEVPCCIDGITITPTRAGIRSQATVGFRRLTEDVSSAFLKRRADDDGRLWLEMSRTYYRSGRNDDAVLAARRSIAAEPMYAEAHLLQALSRWNSEAELDQRERILYRHSSSHEAGYDEAIAACRMAIAVDPNYTRAYLYLGEFCYQRYRHKETADAFSRLRRRNPACAEALYGQGLGRLMRNDRAGALKVYEQLKPRDAALALMLFGHIYPNTTP